MDSISFQYHLRKLLRMFYHGGFSHTFRYYATQLFYAHQTISRFWYITLRQNTYPTMIEIEPTTYCNLKCKVCEHTYWNEKPRHLKFEEFKKIVDQFPKLRWIGLTGIGSSFLNPDYLKMLELVKKRKIYTVIIDTMNGLDEEKMRQLVQLKIDLLVVSMMGARPQTYNRHMVGADFQRTVRNILRIQELKKELKKVYPEISFHYIVTKENIEEAAEFLYLVRNIIEDRYIGVCFSPILTPFAEVDYLSTDLPELIIKELQSVAHSLKIKLSVNRSILKENVRRCIEWSQPFIFSDGSVIPCCAGNEANQRRQQIINRLGNILEIPFNQLWSGKHYNALRDSVRRGRIPKFCVSCALYEEKTPKR